MLNYAAFCLQNMDVMWFLAISLDVTVVNFVFTPFVLNSTTFASTRYCGIIQMGGEGVGVGV